MRDRLSAREVTPACENRHAAPLLQWPWEKSRHATTSARSERRRDEREDERAAASSRGRGDKGRAGAAELVGRRPGRESSRAVRAATAAARDSREVGGGPGFSSTPPRTRRRRAQHRRHADPQSSSPSPHRRRHTQAAAWRRWGGGSSQPRRAAERGDSGERAGRGSAGGRQAARNAEDISPCPIAGAKAEGKAANRRGAALVSKSHTRATTGMTNHVRLSGERSGRSAIREQYGLLVCALVS